MIGATLRRDNSRRLADRFGFVVVRPLKGASAGHEALYVLFGSAGGASLTRNCLGRSSGRLLTPSYKKGMSLGRPRHA